MHRRPTFAALTFAALGAAALAAGSGAAVAADRNAPKGGQTYRWVDDKNVVHYGDRVPPEYAKRERAVLNDQGVEVGKVEAERTPEQIAEIERRDKLAREQKQHDEFLLTTYTSVRDIEGLRDQRLSQLADQRASTETYIESLNDRLAQLQLRAQTFRPYNPSPGARQMPDKLAEDLVRTLNEVRRQRQALDDRRNEETALRARFQSDIDRFRLLRSRTTAAR
ncbi:MAG: DUF4124 domain-containing protein [Steroidobacteraceae bacterium]|jgi:hypothetical protein|nr:DUF4124 domain-containing protein [Steroidobacteraceae bacterium]